MVSINLKNLRKFSNRGWRFDIGFTGDNDRQYARYCEANGHFEEAMKAYGRIGNTEKSLELSQIVKAQAQKKAADTLYWQQYDDDKERVNIDKSTKIDNRNYSTHTSTKIKDSVVQRSNIGGSSSSILSDDEMMRKFDERLSLGEISEKTYKELRVKYYRHDFKIGKHYRMLFFDIEEYTKQSVKNIIKREKLIKSVIIGTDRGGNMTSLKALDYKGIEFLKSHTSDGLKKMKIRPKR